MMNHYFFSFFFIYFRKNSSRHDQKGMLLSAEYVKKSQADISGMADVLANRMLLTVQGEYYEIRSKGSICFRKYLEIWREK